MPTLDCFSSCAPQTMTADVPLLMTNVTELEDVSDASVTLKRCQAVVTVLGLAVPVWLSSSMRRLTVAVPDEVFIQTLPVQVAVVDDIETLCLTLSVPVP